MSIVTHQNYTHIGMEKQVPWRICTDPSTDWYIKNVTFRRYFYFPSFLLPSLLILSSHSESGGRYFELNKYAREEVSEEYIWREEPNWEI
jgi:hypothetical protein